MSTLAGALEQIRDLTAIRNKLKEENKVLLSLLAKNKLEMDRLKANCYKAEESEAQVMRQNRHLERMLAIAYQDIEALTADILIG